MVDRTAEDIKQDSRLAALEKRPQAKADTTTAGRLDKLEADMAALQAKLKPFDDVVKFIQELRFRGHLPNIVGF